MIGYSNSGNFLNCDGVLVVNRKVSDEKAVSAFLEYLLREEVQDSHRNHEPGGLRGFPGEQCPVPILAEEDLMLSIVWEQAEAFMVGDKSAEDAAGIIHKRIQLYLDENR